MPLPAPRRPLRRPAIAPVLAVLLVLTAIWYAAAIGMNSRWERDQAARAGTVPTPSELVLRSLSQDRPVLPAPHQVAAGLADGLFGQPVTSRRSLVWHAWVTLSATLAGFGIGAVAGTALALGIVHSRTMDLSVMPWAVASQTVPVLAIAPMVIVVLSSMGVTGLLPKALIAAWLSFFPVLVGMVKGLRSPDAMQLDQMRSWNAGPLRVLLHLRLPCALPYLFASLKVAIAAALVGTIVAELPAGATAGLGARLLSGSYYGQTVQIWSALFVAAGMAALLVALTGRVERAVLSRMGVRA